MPAIPGAVLTTLAVFAAGGGNFPERIHWQTPLSGAGPAGAISEAVQGSVNPCRPPGS